MSDLLGLHLCFRVFTPDGDLYVSDSADGDRRLHALLVQYPDATVITKDRETGKAVGEKIPLLQLLHEERGLVAVQIEPNGTKGAA